VRDFGGTRRGLRGEEWSGGLSLYKKKIEKREGEAINKCSVLCVPPASWPTPSEFVPLSCSRGRIVGLEVAIGLDFDLDRLANEISLFF
jgi:hypothetical protein